MNSKGLVLVFLIYGLLLAALFTRDGALLSLALPFLAYLIMGALRAPSRLRLSAWRSIEAIGVEEGEPVEVRIRVKNQATDLENLQLSDPLQASMQLLEGKVSRQLALPAGETAELRYIFSAARGHYEWTSVRVSAADPFDLFQVQQEIPAQAELLVRPVAFKLRRFPVKPRSTLRTTGIIPARRAGSGCDFLGVREYRAGDSLKHINWRMTARNPRRLYTNEFEREQAADFGMILDARRLTDAGEVEQALFEHSISAAAALARLFLKQGNRLALLVFGESMQCIYPGYGKKQLNLVLRTMARAELGRSFPIDYLKYVPARLFPSRSVILMISPLGPNDQEAYARLRAWGHDVLLISPDPVDYARRNLLPDTGTDRLASRLARLERRLQLHELARLGVKVVDWQTSQPLESILQRLGPYLTHQPDLSY